MFRNRQTGRITIAQWPNTALSVFFVATVVRSIAAPSGIAAMASNSLARGALIVWAMDELFRGFNPWRRMVGGGTLAWQAQRLLIR